MLALPPLAAEPVFSILSFSITNTYINSSIAVVVFAILGLLLRVRVAEVPHGLQNAAEAAIDFICKYFDQVTGSRARTVRFLPIVGSLFFFILLSNWLGIFPGVGSIGVTRMLHGEQEFIPIFRPAATDLNLTLAMAVAAVVFSHIAGVFAIGFFKYANKFVKLGDIWHAVLTRSGTKILTAIIEFFVGFIEIISEAAKMASLSLRLFGNIFAGEVLMTVIGGLIAFLVPLPFMALEILVGLIQAAVFSMLVLVYLTVSTEPVVAHH
ncbi:MAG: ATP synthase F0 subunit A [Candidatus Doudnabacteria bacterium RIFCSPHIGHO2_01_FULL_50_11]|uniref:ATP synthase subunit a n=1 Tax=Candidatus Doudnabacteria bacterium RIFCSPHIGHO2_01_FULL_50_11 TaxID=1817828 RepID=A0A1F5PIG7_9BACT|nr:MAG: ATP synthase F0 subunit A [Candidatus Doudnabacteria bacterium RIFCSPHIGHO2_01_FULL_50_11]HLC44288.1 F0F1 ATP synthase subunit A [Patescibacteria group bacterium]